VIAAFPLPIAVLISGGCVLVGAGVVCAIVEWRRRP